MSSKTPRKQSDETESAPNKGRAKPSPASLLVGVILLVFGGWLLLRGISQITDNKQFLYAPNGKITVEIVDQDAERYKGLSYRDGIDGGMLFVYDTPSTEHCLTMRDMNFAIDMVWIDQDKRVIFVESDVSPDTYPQVFCAEQPSQYLLELSAGQAAELGITENERLVF